MDNMCTTSSTDGPCEQAGWKERLSWTQHGVRSEGFKSMEGAYLLCNRLPTEMRDGLVRREPAA